MKIPIERRVAACGLRALAAGAGPLAACLILGLPGLALSQIYTITDLNAPTDIYRLAHGMNATGQVVGEYEATNLLTVSAFWWHNGTSTDLGLLAGYIDAYAYSINDNGQIAGWCDNYAGSERGFRYANGTMTELGTLGGLPTQGYSEAYAINRSGEVVGMASLSNVAIYHAVLYSGTTKLDLGSLGGPTYNSTAYGLNNVGVIVGDSEVTNSSYPHGFTYSNNIMADLGTLPGGSYSHASAVNDSGVIVGEADTLTATGIFVHAFVCAHGAGSLQDLGTFGGNESSAYAVNGTGRIVGYAVDSNNVSRAFLYDGSQLVDLNTLIPPNSGWANLEAAVGINDNGQIAGYGKFPDGVYHAFLLTPAGPLTVAITNPAPNAVFTAPATFPIAASVSDTAGSVTNVQFLVNGSPVGDATSAPYSVTVSNLAAGNYTLSAVAADNGGLKATNSLGITVKSALAPITLTGVSFTAGAFSFSFGTQTGHTYACEFTTPLSLSNNWTTFTNLSGDGSAVTVTDPAAADNQRYYRVVAQ